MPPDDVLQGSGANQALADAAGSAAADAQRRRQRRPSARWCSGPGPARPSGAPRGSCTLHLWSDGEPRARAMQEESARHQDVPTRSGRHAGDAGDAHDARGPDAGARPPAHEGDRVVRRARPALIGPMCGLVPAGGSGAKPSPRESDPAKVTIVGRRRANRGAAAWCSDNPRPIARPRRRGSRAPVDRWRPSAARAPLHSAAFDGLTVRAPKPTT